MFKEWKYVGRLKRYSCGSHVERGREESPDYARGKGETSLEEKLGE